MRVLITGSKGFIGSSLARLLKAYRHEVTGYDLDSPRLPRLDGFDWVVHLGAISATTECDVEKILANNLDFSCELLKKCNKKGVNFQYASSASVYGSGPGFSEDSPPQPQSPYAWSKYLFDRYVSQHKWRIHVQGYRYFNVYGEGELHKGNQASPISKFRQQARQQGEITLFEGSRNYQRDFVCVYDVCRVHHAMMEMGTSLLWNVGTGSPVSFQEIGEIIAEQEGVPVRYIPMPTVLKGQYQDYTCADITRLSHHLQMKWIDVRDYLLGGSQYNLDTARANIAS